jgi:hypothetical protein
VANHGRSLDLPATESSGFCSRFCDSAQEHSLTASSHEIDKKKILTPSATRRDYERLPPDVWKQSHPEAIRAYRQEERRDKADRKQ